MAELIQVFFFVLLSVCKHQDTQRILLFPLILSFTHPYIFLPFLSFPPSFCNYAFIYAVCIRENVYGSVS